VQALARGAGPLLVQSAFEPRRQQTQGLVDPFPFRRLAASRQHHKIDPGGQFPPLPPKRLTNQPLPTVPYHSIANFSGYRQSDATVKPIVVTSVNDQTIIRYALAIIENALEIPVASHSQLGRKSSVIHTQNCHLYT